VALTPRKHGHSGQSRCPFSTIREWEDSSRVPELGIKRISLGGVGIAA
jgi:hypothetical protein